MEKIAGLLGIVVGAVIVWAITDSASQAVFTAGVALAMFVAHFVGERQGFHEGINIACDDTDKAMEALEIPMEIREAVAKARCLIVKARLAGMSVDKIVIANTDEKPASEEEEE